MKIITLCGLAAFTAALAGCQSAMTIKTKPYPVARMDTTVADDYHGTIVKDPYRWLEDDRSAETAAWAAAENEVTQDYLSQIPYRERIKQRLTQLYDYPKEGTPFRVGEYYFFYKNDGLQNQSILYRRKGLDGEPEVFIDPNTLSADGTAALNTVTFSQDDRYAAYSVARSGSDWVKIYVMEVATRRQLPDSIEWVKFSGASWGKDGFYYSGYDAPEPGSGVYSAKNEYQKVYFHRLGTSQTEDQLIYEDREHPLRYFSGFVSDDFRWLFIVGSEGTSGAEILYKRADEADAPFRTLFKGFANDYSIIDCVGDTAYVLTNDAAPNFRLVSVDLSASEAAGTCCSGRRRQAGRFLQGICKTRRAGSINTTCRDAGCGRSNCRGSARQAVSTARRKIRKCSTDSAASTCRRPRTAIRLPTELRRCTTRRK